MSRPRLLAATTFKVKFPIKLPTTDRILPSSLHNNPNHPVDSVSVYIGNVGTIGKIHPRKNSTAYNVVERVNHRPNSKLIHVVITVYVKSFWPSARRSVPRPIHPYVSPLRDMGARVPPWKETTRLGNFFFFLGFFFFFFFF